jgi:hypothetical protein
MAWTWEKRRGGGVESGLIDVDDAGVGVEVQLEKLGACSQV